MSEVARRESISTNPIADLSYRNYDGPLSPPQFRWWAIARVGIQSAFKKKSFWVFTVFSGLWYAIMMIVFYFLDSFTGQLPGANALDPTAARKALLNNVNWNEIFLHAFSRAQLWYFIIALLIGVGSIANDNRANALLVYLSKPCTKLDYVIGKWVGIFVPITLAAAIPTFFFYGYCFMSYRDNGFLKDGWLFFKLIPLVLVPGIFYASISLGISSLFKHGRIAGATFAGLFFFTYFFTVAMGAVHMSLRFEGGSPKIVDSLFYASIDGLNIGLSKVILGTSGYQPLPFMPRGGPMVAPVPAPNGFVMTVIFLGICFAALGMAWSKVRAVEVVS